MRILMFGRGVIATIYGQALQEAGHDVEFYVRRGRAAAYGYEVQLDLVDTRSRRLGGRVRQVVPTRLRESVEPGDGFELVVLSVGHHQLPAAAEFLAPRIGDATVLVFGNIWDEPIAAVAPLPSAQVVFGFPQAGGGFGEDGVLHGGLLGRVIVGTSGEAPSLRESAVQEAFRTAGLAVRTQRDMRGWLWLHFVADAGMHAEGLRRGGLAAMIGDRQAFREALLTSRELLPVLQARGIDLRRHRRSTIGYHLSAPAAAGMAWASVHVPIARASLAAHTDPEAAEPRAVLRDTVHEARRLGVPAPRLEASLQLHP
ncbi:ketopantoate reductase family protein [Microlunatus ginsengisoli]|uniref:2-dehydropantoate 2-reductase N-terminal domain-containing protein n=1 Tax=Microlunatus ginsengisoli TaxID=363863 RepID=A0ABP7AZ19_9ACTN